MESPCRKICTYDPSKRLCFGCGRTLEEIQGWLEMSETQRRAIMDALPQRLRAAKPAS
jgi:predicted Fe-S protein YdhL (DUF1289 family)